MKYECKKCKDSVSTSCILEFEDENVDAIPDKCPFGIAEEEPDWVEIVDECSCDLCTNGKGYKHEETVDETESDEGTPM